MRRFTCLLLFLLFCGAGQSQGPSLTYTRNNLRFLWNLSKDSATLCGISSRNAIWTGSLLPAWWIKMNGRQQFVKASLVSLSPTTDSQWEARLRVGELGRGTLVISMDTAGIRFRQLTIHWKDGVPAIIAMYFGTTKLDPANYAVSPGWDRPFVPDWQAAGFCVPGAKEGPAQSYFRSWDFGQADIALGSFGPSMGSPYAAAYPRPLLFAGMGGNDGFIVLGAGSIPDAAMSLRILGARGCFEYVYQEDIWGKAKSQKRIWDEPLRLAIAENAWQAFRQYFLTFPVKTSINTNAVKASWNSWGTWARQQYIIQPIAAMAKQAGAGLFVLDGSWEASMGSAKYNQGRFPRFTEEVDSLRATGMELGVWQSTGWIADPFSQGLSSKDLLHNKYGKLCMANWNFDPFGESYYCLDPSSEGARKFLIGRTERLMKTLHPKMLKLDFGYGLPSPAMAVPRDPAYRGEKYAYELVRLIGEAARRIDPEVAIMYYGISPLWTALEDVVSLDDQGDLWYGIKEGHASWSIWASLLGSTHTAISGSSGYDWQQDEEAILNTCILGVPGAVLPIDGKDHQPISGKWLNRRLAINSWFRKTTQWKPLWVNSQAGDFTTAPALRSWGRLEEKDSTAMLTALVLRGEDREKITDERINRISWTGKWALIAQDDQDIFSSRHLALIPFDSGSISIPVDKKPGHIIRKNLEGNSPFTDWIWDGKTLTISVSREILDQTAGFFIE